MTRSNRCLQLDVGNSSAKWRLLRDGQVIERGQYAPGDEPSTAALLASAAQVDQIWMASVAGPDAESALLQLLASRSPVTPWLACSAARTGDLRNSYSEPGRMGVDRWLAMVAGRARTQDRLCVVDAGSALTIDMVNASGQHEGGYIIPGPGLMERALLADTGRVRFEDEVGYDLSPGSSTAAAVRHGIALAQVGALALALDRAGAEVPQLLFCGGGGDALRQMLGRGGDYVADLVFEGLEIMARSAS